MIFRVNNLSFASTRCIIHVIINKNKIFCFTCSYQYTERVLEKEVSLGMLNLNLNYFSQAKTRQFGERM